MNIFPAIDIFDGKAVRLFKGDYQNMTVYSDHPEEIAKDFKTQGARFIYRYIGWSKGKCYLDRYRWSIGSDCNRRIIQMWSAYLYSCRYLWWYAGKCYEW